MPFDDYGSWYNDGDGGYSSDGIDYSNLDGGGATFGIGGGDRNVVDVTAGSDASGWTDNGDGTWTWNDGNGTSYTFDENGEYVNRNANSGPQQSAGSTSTQDKLWEGYTDNGDGTYNKVDAAGNTITYDGETGQVLSSYDQDGLSTTGTDNEIKTVSNPDGSYTEVRPDGVKITHNNDGTVITQNGDGGSTQTTDTKGNTTQTTAAGNNPNGSTADATKLNSNGSVGNGTATTASTTASNSVLDRFKDKDGNYDWTRIIAAGLLGAGGIAALSKMNGGTQTPDKLGYQGGIPALTYNRVANTAPAGNGKGLFLGAGSFTPKAAAGGYLDDITSGASMDPQQQQPPGATMGVGYAKGGGIAAAAPRYLRGATDGMADQVPAEIEGGQPARLAHGEFVVPADVVSHLGNGNSDAGADKLYQMMAKIRKARTGNPKQGKQIDPNKFLPGMKHSAGGIAGLAAPAARFDSGGAVQNSNEQGLANYAGPYVTNMLGQADAVANDMTAHPSNYVYTGERAAGPSANQTAASTAAANLTPNTTLSNAATNAANLSTTMQGQSYTPTTQTNQYSATAAYTPAATGANQYTATGAYTPVSHTNQYTATDPYAAATFTGDNFTGANVAQYMNPYLQQSLDPQIQAARRQADITRMQNASRLVGSGAFGGGRQAIMESEGDRNLLDNLASITGRGYDTAFTNARDQFNQSQNQSLARQQATEASRQFGANQALTNAQNTANYGQQASNAEMADNQFGANLAVTNAQNTANYGQQGINSLESAQQFGANQALTNAQNTANYGQQAINANNANSQFGARFGLDALNSALAANSSAGSLAGQSSADTRANIGLQSSVGATDRDITQQQDNANLAQFNEEAALPGRSLALRQSMLNGLPISATNVAPGPGADWAQTLAGLGLTAAQIAQIMGTMPKPAPTSTP